MNNNDLSASNLNYTRDKITGKSGLKYAIREIDNTTSSTKIGVVSENFRPLFTTNLISIFSDLYLLFLFHIFLLIFFHIYLFLPVWCISISSFVLG